MKREMPPIHPAADIFPMLPDDQLAALAEDIKANGLQQPIVMFGARLLDGRNRWRACEIAGVEPKLRDWSGDDPVAYVVSLNLKRRHLDESQRAMVAARIADMKQGARTDIPQIRGKSQPEAAELLNVGVRSVQDAKKVIERGAPELAAAVDAGKVAVSTAALVSELEPDEQKEVVARGEKEILAAAKEIRARKNEERQIERTERLRVVTLDESARGLYPVIYADPPWQYSNSGFAQSAENQYPTMATPDICLLPVKTKITTNAVLLLWATNPLLEDAMRVIAAWGFEYKTNFVWTKEQHMGGFYCLGQHELLLVAVRGSALPKSRTLVGSHLKYPRGKHSAKPHELYELIERMYDGPYLEMFARNTREGWASFGNEPELAA